MHRQEPQPAALLDVWERGGPLSAGRRALALLAAATGEDGLERLYGLSIGERDADLLSLRERLFGPHVTAVVTCPSCGERQELSFRVDDVRTPRPEPARELSVTVDGVEVRFRLPTTADLDDLDQCSDVETAAAALLRRCVLSVSGDGPLSTPLAEAVEERMAVADPQGDVQLALHCDGCGVAWTAPFDIAAFLWSELDAWAWRLVADVDQLARTYGWTERDVLALSPRRRRIYVEVATR